ncbi:MAG: two-component regulator propeller domain-containing protein, partial [Pyrinomonadaceae bacterium]
MQISIRSKTFLKLSVFSLLILFALSTYFAQQPEPSATPSPEASPSASPTPTPPRTPSPTPLPGAQNFHQWGSITVFNGLPSDSVRAIAQTPDGVMWFGTDNGLARFDGRRIQNFSPDGSGLNRIQSLKTASSGELWVGTQAGAFVYGESGFRLVDGTKGIGVTAMLAGEEIVIGTDTGMVMRTKDDGSGNRTVENLLTTPIQTAEGAPLAVTGLARADGMLLASTSGRGVLAVRDGRASELSRPRMPVFVNSLAIDSAENLSLGSDAPTGLSGIYEEGGSGFARISVPTARVLALESNDSGLWVGTERFGVFHVVGSKVKKAYTFENTSGGLRSNTVYTFFTDREGVVWIGTNRGVSRFDRLGASQETLSDSANANFIRTLFRSADGTVYAGSNRGLFRKVDDKWEPDASQGSRAIFAINEDRSGKLLVGSADRITSDQKESTREAATWAFADFKGEKYAAVNGTGLVQVRAAGNIVRSQERSISSLCAVGDRLFIGTTDRGLFSFDGRAVKNELGPDELQSGTIWKISSDTDGTLWIAGEHGVFRVR